MYRLTKANHQPPCWQAVWHTPSMYSGLSHSQWPYAWPGATVRQRTADTLTNDLQAMWPWQLQKRWYIPPPHKISGAGVINYFETSLTKAYFFFLTFHSERGHKLPINSNHSTQTKSNEEWDWGKQFANSQYFTPPHGHNMVGEQTNLIYLCTCCCILKCQNVLVTRLKIITNLSVW